MENNIQNLILRKQVTTYFSLSLVSVLSSPTYLLFSE